MPMFVDTTPFGQCGFCCLIQGRMSPGLFRR